MGFILFLFIYSIDFYVKIAGDVGIKVARSFASISFVCLISVFERFLFYDSSICSKFYANRYSVLKIQTAWSLNSFWDAFSVTFSVKM